MSDITLLIMTDGRRDCLQNALPSALDMLQGVEFKQIVIHDDSADPDYRDWLRVMYGGYCTILGGPQRLGFGGAYHRAWNYLDQRCKGSWVFSTEDDFVFNRQVDVPLMAEVMRANPYLVQMALKRQPWNADEIRAGGIVELNPKAFTDRAVGTAQWLEHDMFFTTNPSLFRRSLATRGWPLSDQSEGLFTAKLKKDPDVRFAYWGARSDPPWVTHIGRDRVGKGY